MAMIKELLLNGNTLLKSTLQSQRNATAIKEHTRTDHLFFQHELQKFLGVPLEWLQETAIEYRNCRRAWHHLSGLQSASRKTDGAAKSLDVAEGFALWALVKHVRPQVVVELGVLYGISSRLWKEALKTYVPDHQLILCDLEDKRRFITDEECTFLQADARAVLPDIFATHNVGILHNDAHPYDLIRWSVMEALDKQVPVLTFHDVGRGARCSFRAESSLLAEDVKLANTEYTPQYGHWERHVMAEVFDERILEQDAVVNEKYRMQIFDSLFGFGVTLTDG